jgi:hypothetical protein
VKGEIVSYNPYGVMGSVITPPRDVRVSKAWKGSRSKRFSNLVVRDKSGNIIVAIEDSQAVKLARRTIKNAKPKPLPATLRPLTEIELRKIKAQERLEVMAKLLAKPADNYL